MRKSIIVLFIILFFASLLLGIFLAEKYQIIAKQEYLELKHNYDDLRSLYSWGIKNPNIANSIIQDEDGQDMLIDSHDAMVSKYILLYGIWEPHVRNIFRQVIKPKDTILTLGGHIGVHIGLLSRLVSPEGKLYVFEPNPDSLNYLKTNIMLNPVYNIKLFEKAAFSENKILEFCAIDPNRNSGGSHVITADNQISPESKKIQVDGVRLDDIAEISSIDILQMDIEGAEPHAVAGAKKLIENSPNLTVIQEWSPSMMDKDLAKDYIKFWQDKGYKFGLIKCWGIFVQNPDELMNLPLSDIIISKNLDQLIHNFKKC